MVTKIGSEAPTLAADAYVRGERARRFAVSDFRGSWVVVAFAVRRSDVIELAELEESFAADGAVVLAATPDDRHDVEHRYANEHVVRFPILTGVDERRRITAIVDPAGVVRHIGLRRSARETLAMLEGRLVDLSRAAA
jgi:alkyl hydroperoxide reductase subunit AhpC